MIAQELVIQNKLGIHTRAAAKLVNLAKKFHSKIELTFRERTVNAKGIMGLITLGAQKDHVVNITLSGEDEKEAFIAIQQLVNDKFHERE